MPKMSGVNGKKRKEEQYTVTFEGLEWLEHHVLPAEISLIQEYFSEEIAAMFAAGIGCSHSRKKEDLIQG